MDFTLHVNREGEIRILQLTDTQVIFSYEGKESNRETHLYAGVRRLVERTKPDLIVITGDILYGRFDVDGKGQKEFNAFMDSFEIPWAPVYGNHDYENEMGQEWLNEQYRLAKYCLYAKGDVTGDSNYTIGICQNGEYIREVCMVDSNGWTRLEMEFQKDQLDWIRHNAGENGLPTLMFYHVPTEDFQDAAIAAGYQDGHETKEDRKYFEIGVDVPAKNGDFGKKKESYGPNFGRLLPLMKECHVDGVFVGHQHIANTSILWEGIRFTFGFKTGTYDYHDENALGGTLIRLNGREFTVEHQHCEF